MSESYANDEIVFRDRGELGARNVRQYPAELPPLMELLQNFETQAFRDLKMFATKYRTKRYGTGAKDFALDYLSARAWLLSDKGCDGEHISYGYVCSTLGFENSDRFRFGFLRELEQIAGANEEAIFEKAKLLARK